MHGTHFGLTRALFGEGIPADAAVFRRARHDDLLARYKLAFGSTSSALVVRGQPGIGKTTLTASALRATSTRLALAWINGVPTNGGELLELILVELGIGTLNTSRIEQLQLWRQCQAELRATDSRLFIVVERAEDLSIEVLHALDQYTAPDAIGNLGANLVLLGHATIDDHLSARLLDSLRQRIRVHIDLTPFSETELEAYLRHQVAFAGGHFDHVFAPGAVAALYDYSNGVARLVNTICETALDVAAAKGHELLTADLIGSTARQLLKLEATAPRDSVPAAVASGTSRVSQNAHATGFAEPQGPDLHASVSLNSHATVQLAPQAVAPASTPASAPVVATPPSATRVEPHDAYVRQQVAGPAVTEAVSLDDDVTSIDVADDSLNEIPVLTDIVDPRELEALLQATLETAPAVASTPQPGFNLRTRVDTAHATLKPMTEPVPPTVEPIAGSEPPALTTALAEGTATNAAISAVDVLKPKAITALTTEDILREDGRLRGVSAPKPVDDISSSMADTLFCFEEFDFLAATVPTPIERQREVEGEPESAPISTATPVKRRAPLKITLPNDDPFDLIGLSNDAYGSGR